MMSDASSKIDYNGHSLPYAEGNTVYFAVDSPKGVQILSGQVDSPEIAKEIIANAFKGGFIIAENRFKNVTLLHTVLPDQDPDKTCVVKDGVLARITRAVKFW